MQLIRLEENKSKTCFCSMVLESSGGYLPPEVKHQTKVSVRRVAADLPDPGRPRVSSPRDRKSVV